MGEGGVGKGLEVIDPAKGGPLLLTTNLYCTIYPLLSRSVVNALPFICPLLLSKYQHSTHLLQWIKSRIHLP